MIGDLESDPLPIITVYCWGVDCQTSFVTCERPNFLIGSRHDGERACCVDSVYTHCNMMAL